MGFLIFWLICGCAAGVVASSKGRSGAGWFLLGVLLGPIALFMVGFMPKLAPQPVTPPGTFLESVQARSTNQPSDTRTCPFCAEEIKQAAIVCKHCGRDVEPQSPTTQPPQA